MNILYFGLWYKNSVRLLQYKNSARLLQYQVRAIQMFVKLIYALPWEDSIENIAKWNVWSLKVWVSFHFERAVLHNTFVIHVINI